MPDPTSTSADPASADPTWAGPPPADLAPADLATKAATPFSSHPTDRLALGVGLLLAVQAAIVIAQQAGWISPSPATLIAIAAFALAVVGVAAAVAILRDDRRRLR